MSTISSQISPALLCSGELAKAAHCLSSTRDDLHAAVTGLSDAQWHFKPGPDRWSIAEVLEHVVLIEERVHAIVLGMRDSPPGEPDRPNLEIEEVILTEVPKRSERIQAPPQVSPSGQWTPAETVTRFFAGRARTVELLVEAPCLRGHVRPHPVFGPWDGYQWILAAGAHSARHTNQILEVKAHAGFVSLH